MKKLSIALVTVAASGCALNLGGPSDIEMPTALVRVDAGSEPTAVAATLREAGIRAAVVAARSDAAWFDALGSAASLSLSGPAEIGGLQVAFLTAIDAVGDTTLDLAYDGGVITVHDALYEVEEGRYLDLLAFQVDESEEIPDALAAFLEYIATDVANNAAVVIAVAVPSAEIGDAVVRMLGPGFFDAMRCGGASPPPVYRESVRLLYGPEARMFCTDAAAEAIADGAWVRAQLTLGRR